MLKRPILSQARVLDVASVRKWCAFGATLVYTSISCWVGSSSSSAAPVWSEYEMMRCTVFPARGGGAHFTSGVRNTAPRPTSFALAVVGERMQHGCFKQPGCV